MRILLVLLLFISGVSAQSAAELLKQLTGNGSGSDAKARTQLMKMAHTSAKKEGSQREAHEAAVLAALKGSKSNEVKTFLIQQLEICGGKASLVPVASYLNDKDLNFNAARTLIQLSQYDKAKAGELIFKAYASAGADNKANLLNAISVMKFMDSRATSAYRGALTGKPEIKEAALQGLAQIGDSADAAVFIKTFEDAKPVFRGRAFRLNLVYAEKLGAKNKSQASAHLAKLESLLKKDEIPFITGIASADFTINGVSDKWLDRLPTSNVHTQIGIVRVFKVHKYAGLAAKLKSRVEASPDKPVYLQALAAVDGNAAAPYIIKGLQSSNAEVKAICSKLSVSYGSAMVPSLAKAALTKPTIDKNDVKRLSSMVNDKNVDAILEFWKGDKQDLNLALIEMTANIRKPAVASKMLAAAGSADKKVQKAAVKALKDVVSKDNLVALLSLLEKESSSTSVRYLQTAAGYAIETSDKATVDKLVAKVSSARNDKLLGALAKSNRSEVLGVIKKDAMSSDATVQKNIIKTISGMKPEHGAALLLTVVEKAVDDRNRIVAARAFASAVEASTEENNVRRDYINKALKQKLPDAEKKLLQDRLKKIPAAKGKKSKAKPSENDSKYVPLFNGKDLNNWDNQGDYKVKDGIITGKGGRLYSKQKYKDFSLKFEFKLEPGTNNGLAIRSPLKGRPIELQIIDNKHKKYEKIKDYQRHGSIYNYVPAKTGFLKSTGEWNSQEVICKGSMVKVILNGTTILEADLSKVKPIGKRYVIDYINNATEGHIGFLGHNSPVSFRNIMIKEL